MDDAEEELKKKLTQLERSVFDPSLGGRAEEIWARMLAIREQSKRLQMEMERAGPRAAAQADDQIDENTMKTAKKVCFDTAVATSMALLADRHRSSTTTTHRSSTCRRSSSP